jgi:hypothetical protein
MSELAQRAHDRVDSRSQRGAALLVAVMMLSLLGIIGLASLDTVMRDRQVAGFQGRARTAMYAADAGVSTGMGIIRNDKVTGNLQSQAQLQNYNPAFPTTGAPQILGGGGAADPRFNGDPAAPQPVRFVGMGQQCKGMITQQNQGGPQFMEALFDIRVQGRTPEGATSTVQATTTLCHAFVP